MGGVDGQAVPGGGIGFGGGGTLVLSAGYMLIQERIVLQGAGALAGTGSTTLGGFESKFASVARGGFEPGAIQRASGRTSSLDGGFEPGAHW
jgi:hypothetical protein